MGIKKSSKISKIMEKYPKTGEILISKYGLHCVGCFGAAFETIEQGAKAHGMTKKQIEKMLKELNEKIK